jgi:hypothetical protein
MPTDHDGHDVQGLNIEIQFCACTFAIQIQETLDLVPSKVPTCIVECTR